MLPRVSLGMWHNFGGVDGFENGRAMVRRAFDLGITHFDLANNYGPPPGSAEMNFGRMLELDLRPYRDEMVIATKAGYRMGPGPYGEWGSRKYMLSSLDASLRRLGVEWVDIFYHHRPDPDTPLEETMGALAQAVRSGKALYVGLSNYSPEMTVKAAGLLREMGVAALIHQPCYNMLRRDLEEGLLEVLEKEGMGCIPFSPLAQGLLTDRYLGGGIPEDARAAKAHGFLKAGQVTPERLAVIGALNEVAKERGQTLAQMALGWVLRDARVTTVLIGASKPEQLEGNVKAVDGANFSEEELVRIDGLLAGWPK